MPRGKKKTARQFLPLSCRATTLTAGVSLKEEKKPSLVGERPFGGYLRDNLGEGNCESKIAARQWGVNFCREALRCLAGAVRECRGTPTNLGVNFGHEFFWGGGGGAEP